MKIENVMDEMIDINECSVLLGISVSSLRKMCMKRQIPFHKFGGKVRFYKPDLATWAVRKNRTA